MASEGSTHLIVKSPYNEQEQSDDDVTSKVGGWQMVKSDLVVSFDKEVGTCSVEPRTPEAGAWLEEQTCRKGTFDTNEQGAHDLGNRARKAGFTVHWADTVDPRGPKGK